MESTLICDFCENETKRKHPSQRFCKTKCKDRYHNRQNPRGYYAHLNYETRDTDRDIEDDEHPHSAYALGQS